MKRERKHTHTKRPQNVVCKVPVVMQMEALECGAASLAMILAYYGKWFHWEQVGLDCGVSRDDNARNVHAARNYGLIAKGISLRAGRKLKQNGEFPLYHTLEF